MTRFLLYIFVVTASINLINCNAPHNNPLDPENPINNYAVIEGFVFSDGKSPVPLVNSSVFWKNENLSVFTNTDGYFNIKNVLLKDGWLYFDKLGFSRDSIFISWNDQKSYSVKKNLNELPQIDSVYFYSIVKFKYSVEEYQLNFEINISDSDNDIDSVFIQNNALSIYKKLDKLSSTFFKGSFTDLDLKLPLIDEVIGKDFDVIVKNSNNKIFNIGFSNIKRILNQEVEFIEPKNQDTLKTKTPLLRWKRFQPGFTFNYMIEIFTDEPDPKLVYSKDNISSEDIDFLIPTPIDNTINKKFFWVIWAIDEYKNRCRSKPASFIIE